MLQRYLIYFSYIGTSYLGAQRQFRPDKTIDSRSVQGVLDLVLKRIWSYQVCKTTISSRTDTGVHAISSTAHFDWESEYDRRPPLADHVTASMNKVLRCYNEHSSLRITKTLAVPSSFHCRHSAKLRSYLYRLAVLRSNVDMSIIKRSADFMLPIVERNRCHVAFGPFNHEAFANALNLFNGRHDFATFMASPSKSTTTRTVQDMNVSLAVGRPFMDPKFDPLYEDVTFYDVSFEARFFLYKQIRRMVGTAITVARGNLTLDRVKFMLENPSQESWNVLILLASADGLFLRQVRYDDQDFLIAAKDSSKINDLTQPTKVASV